MPQPPERSGCQTRVDHIVDRARGLALRRIVVGPLDTNCWAVHAVGHRQALLIDPGDEPDKVLTAVADLQIVAIVLTHAHFDHVLALPEVAAVLQAPVLAHADENQVWQCELATLQETGTFDAGTATAHLLTAGHTLRPDQDRRLWDGVTDASLTDGQIMHAGPVAVRILHTPGHTPGGISVAAPGHVFTGDTLFPGGPGLTGWPLSDFPTIMPSVRRLLDSPGDTALHPGHGPSTTTAAQQPALEHWQERGW